MSPGEVHMGKISIRLPLVFAEPLSLDSDRRRVGRGVNADARLTLLGPRATLRLTRPLRALDCERELKGCQGRSQ